MSERLPVPETLERAFESAKHLPSDWELAQGKAVGWATLEKKLSRTDRWRRWKPVAGVLAGVAVVLAVVLTGQTLHLWSGTTSDQPGASNAAKPAGKGDETAKKKQPSTTMSVYQMRVEAYRKQGMELLYTDPATQADLVRERSKLLLVKEAQRDVLLDVEEATTINPFAFSGSNLLVDVTLNKGEQQYYLLNLSTKQAKQVPMRTGSSTMQVGLWGTEHPKVVYVYLDMEAKQQRVIAVDPDTGEEQVLLQTPAEQSIQQMYAHDDQLIVGWQHELRTYDGRNWQTVARDEERRVTVMYNDDFTKDAILYMVEDSFKQVSMSDMLNKGRLFLYNLKTKQSRQLLPDAPAGEQRLVMPRMEGHPYYLVSNFVVDPKPENAKLADYELTGTLQFWQVPEQEGAAKLIHETKVKGSQRAVFANIEAGQDSLDEIPLVQPMKYADWSLLYRPKQGTIEKVEQSQQQ